MFKLLLLTVAMAEIVPKERINSRDIIRELLEKNPKKEMKTTELPDTTTESRQTTSTTTSTSTSTSTYSNSYSYPGNIKNYFYYLYKTIFITYIDVYGL